MTLTPYMDSLLQDTFWKQADTVTSVLVHVSFLAAAVAGVIKFRILNIFSRRYRSELQCRHHSLPDGKVVFEADYTVTNTGERPIDLSLVSLDLCAAMSDGPLLVPERQRILASRIRKPTDPDKHGLFRIEAGERSIFTLRCLLPRLEPVVFVVCQLSWPDKRQLAPYVGMYVAHATPSIPNAAV